MKIFDMHVHIDSKEPDGARLLERLEQSGVWGAALISAAPELSCEPSLRLPYRERLQNLLSWTKADEKRLIPVLWVHPEETNIADKIRNAADSGVKAFKVICESHHVYSPECMRMLLEIEKTGRPVIFHSGILWSGADTSRYNRPADWEALLRLSRIKFSMGHCSWPWYDECIAVYGKFLNSYLSKKSAEMFFDLTPGTPKIYRRDLLTKLFTVGYDVENNIMFGTDSFANDYDPNWVRGWIDFDNAIYDDLGVTKAQKEKIYYNNFLRFLAGGDTEHRLPHMNKND